MYQAPQHSYQHARPSGPPSLPPPISIPSQAPQSQPYAAYNMSTNVTPPSPTQSSDVNDDGNFLTTTGPSPVSRVWEGKAWALQVVQQPIRARMCGFGDKDRRPISPPPCIRLVIFDPVSGKEVDYEKVADLSRLVLNVDLWNLRGSREDNCVKHNNNSPTVSFPPFTAQPFASPTTSVPSSASSFYPTEDQRGVYGNGGQGYGQRNPSFSYNNNNNNPAPYNPNYSNAYESSHNSRSSQVGSISSSSQLRSARSSQDLGTAKDTPQTAKNLIGSASSSAFRLVDPDGKVGLWFVLQDLSVRTEGWFRLKMNFFNLSEFVLTEDEPRGGVPNMPNSELFQEAPCLATAFSDPFKVFSAKKFPGVIETTALSRQFAKQGIKIPIRKDGNNPKKGGGKGNGGDEEDEGDGADDDEEY